MGKKSRQKRAPEQPERSASPPAPRPQPRPARFKHRWPARLIAIVVVPLVLFGVIEGALRLGGYGYPTGFFVPQNGGKEMATNPKFAWQYYPKKSATSPTPLAFPKEKAPGTTRVFILGESAAAGTPDPAFGFSRMLELMWREQYPGKSIEILNVAMRGIDTHIIRTIAAECASLSPDLFVVYAGNNDMIGLHSPSPGEFRLTSNIHWLRFKDALPRLKLVQLGASALGRLSQKPGPKQDMEFFRRQRLALDDPRRDAVYQHYEQNLRDICRFAERAGAQTLLCTVAVNLRDFPPLASLHRSGLTAESLSQWEKFYTLGSTAEAAGNDAGALASFEEAARLDDHFAELHFRIARCQVALGRTADARRHFALARDWDAMQFRSDGRLNSIVRSLATNAPGRVRLLDVEQAFSQSPLAEDGVPGRRLFQEHVHFTFDGDHQFASVLLPALADALKLPSPARPLLTRDDCSRALAYTVVDDINVRTAINRLTSNPPFLDQLDHAVRQLKANHEAAERLKAITERESQETLAVYRAALAARPDDWMLNFNFGNILAQLNQPAAAVPYYEAVVRRWPNQHKLRFALANALMEAGRPQEAREHFEAALRLDPEFKPARDGLAMANRRR